MKVLITGGSGILGLEVAKIISNAGDSCILYDLVEPSEMPHRTEFVQGDIRDTALLRNSALNCDYGIHLAVVSENHSDDNFFSTNVRGAYSFLKIANETKFQNTVVVGSAPVHLSIDSADKWPLMHTAKDDDRLYDLTKILQEVITKDYHQHGLPVLCLRLGHVVRGEACTNLKGTVALDDITYCHGGWVAIEDVAQACWRALKTEPVGQFQTLNLIGASPGYETYRVPEIEKLLNYKLRYRFSRYQNR